MTYTYIHEYIQVYISRERRISFRYTFIAHRESYMPYNLKHSKRNFLSRVTEVYYNELLVQYAGRYIGNRLYRWYYIYIEEISKWFFMKTIVISKIISTCISHIKFLAIKCRPDNLDINYNLISPILNTGIPFKNETQINYN